jgi:hypothetical protein
MHGGHDFDQPRCVIGASSAVLRRAPLEVGSMCPRTTARASGRGFGLLEGSRKTSTQVLRGPRKRRERPRPGGVDARDSTQIVGDPRV